MKLAHLLLVHKNPSQVKRLIIRLAHKDSDIFIHLDKKCNPADYQHIKNLKNVYFVRNRVKVNWGGYSTLQAAVNGFEEILDNGVAYSHINLLSGQDYPLKDTDHIHDFLFKNVDKSFIKYRSIDDEWHNGRLRVAQYSFGDIDFPIPGKYALERLVNFILPKRKAPLGLKTFGDSTWLTITPRSAQYVIDYLNKHPEVKSFFKLTWGADEVVIQTILLNGTIKDTIVNDNLRYIELGENAHPRVLNSDDAPVLLNSGKLFARKFDTTTDEKIFDELDALTLKAI